MAYAHDPFLWLNAVMAHPALDGLAWFLSFVGNGWVLIPMVVLGLVAKERKKALPICLRFLILIAIAGGIDEVLKQLAASPRPLLFYPAQIASTIHVVGEPLYRNSFPSGHSMVAFFTALFLIGRYGRRALWMLAVAALIGLSRIYVGAHFLLDVLTGAALGSTVAWAGRFIETSSDQA